MRMPEWLKKMLPTTSVSSISAIQTMMAGVPIHKFSDYESYLQAGSKKIWATWKACDITSQVVMGTAFNVVRGKTGNPTEVPDLSRLLRYANPDETFAELLYQTAMHIKLTGSAFWVKDQGRFLDGSRPKNLYALNPKNMKIVPGSPVSVKGYIYRIEGGMDIPFTPDEIIHFKRPHPNARFSGLGDIEAGEPLFNQHLNRNTWEEKFWQNGAAPSQILFCEDQITDKVEWEKAKAEWESKYSGVKNSGKIAWLTGKWRKETMGLSAVDMQDIEKVKLNVEYIFLMHGVPLSVAGVRDAANFATSEIDDQRFRQYTVLPLVKIIEDTLNTDLVGDWGDDLQIKFNVSGLINVAAITQAWQPLFDRGGLTINEFREKLGLERDDENPLWNQTFVMSALVPLDLAGVNDMGAIDNAAKAIRERFIQSSLNPVQK